MHHRPNYQRLGQILIHLDVITHQEVIKARRIQLTEPTSKRIGEIVIGLGHITEEELTRALSLQRDLNQNI